MFLNFFSPQNKRIKSCTNLLDEEETAGRFDMQQAQQLSRIFGDLKYKKCFTETAIIYHIVLRPEGPMRTLFCTSNH